MQCEAFSPAQLVVVRITDLTTHANDILKSASLAGPDFFSFAVSPGDKYKITVRTSNKVTDTYRVTSDGDVTVLHAGL